MLYYIITGVTQSDDDSRPGSRDKWEVQLRKGCLELAILASLWSGRLYGLEIQRQLELRSDLMLTASTLYPVLARLKAEQLVESTWVEQADAGHPRKYYALTPAGRRRAIDMARTWFRFSANLGQLLTPLDVAGRDK
jgi:PadR family transcriptional regulator